MRKITVKLETILDLVSCAGTYGFEDDILFDAFAEMLEYKLTYEEIEVFSREVEAGEDYGEEDYEHIKETLINFKNKYIDEK